MLSSDPNSSSFGRGISGRWRIKNQLNPSSKVHCLEKLEYWTYADTHPADWSRVHGFFAAMGGFVDGTTLLSLNDIERLVRSKEIEYPIVTREEIQDKSKGDAVTKALVVLQTTWFLLQCAARGSQHLALTELEIATAAFALLNIIIYALWWDKPLDVQCCIVVRRRSTQDDASEADADQHQEGSQPLEESGIPPRQERDYWSRSLESLRSAWDGLRRVFRRWSWGNVLVGLLRGVIKPFLVYDA